MEREPQPLRKPRTTKPGRPPASGPTYAVAPPIHDEAALDAALALLQARDPDAVGHMLAVAGRPPLRRREPGFPGLVAIILGQQLSTASAAAIAGRLAKAVDPLTADAILACDEPTLRAAGLSGPKINALRAVARAVADGSLPLDGLDALPAEEAHRALTAVKGVGPWTAHSFLLFCLGHPDAWPAGDLALQEAARLVLKLDARPRTTELDALGERWRPHRGVAARLLWAYYRAVKMRSGVVLDP